MTYAGMEVESFTSSSASRYTVLALYKFASLPPSQLTTLKIEIEEKLRSVQARGTIILASEGINGTICYPEEKAATKRLLACHGNSETAEHKATDLVIEFLHQIVYFSGIRTRVSYAETAIFHRLKVKIKNVIVIMTDADCDEENGSSSDAVEKEQGAVKVVDPTKTVGTYIKAGKEWDDLLMDPDVVVVDTRNKYEVEVGTFENAVSPNTDNFKQFPDWLHRLAAACKEAGDGNDGEEQCVDSPQPEQSRQQCDMNSKSSSTSSTNARSLEPVPDSDMPTVLRKPKAVAMFCTGGIRCEKSTSYALAQNVFPPDVPVYHLDGGILSYLDSHPDSKSSKWQGECFVFDQRVALGHGLKPSGTYNSCHGCRRPVSEEDKAGEDYIRGVCCKHCKAEVSERQKERFVERQRQIDLAGQKGKSHIHDPKEHII